MNFEFFILVLDYLSSLKKKEFVFDCVIPLFIGGATFLFVKPESIMGNLNDYLTFITVMLGFSLAALTMFLSSDNDLVEKAKVYKTNRIIGGKNISLYRLMIVQMCYLIIIEAFLCLSYFIGGLLASFVSEAQAHIANCLFLTMLIHVVVMTIRSVTDLYFIFTSDNKNIW